MPRAELKKNYYFVRVESPKKFKRGTFRAQDVGRHGHTLRIAAVKRSTGKWATQAWRLHKSDVRVAGGKLVGKTRAIKKILKSVPAAHKKVKIKKHERRVN